MLNMVNYRNDNIQYNTICKSCFFFLMNKWSS